MDVRGNLAMLCLSNRIGAHIYKTYKLLKRNRQHPKPQMIETKQANAQREPEPDRGFYNLESYISRTEVDWADENARSQAMWDAWLLVGELQARGARARRRDSATGP